MKIKIKIKTSPLLIVLASVLGLASTAQAQTARNGDPTADRAYDHSWLEAQSELARYAYGQNAGGSVVLNAPNLANLEWLRCNLSQSWDGSTCVGRVRAYTLFQANDMVKAFNAVGYSGKSDWRLPTARELQALRVCENGLANAQVDIQDGGPTVSKHCAFINATEALDLTVFPNPPRNNRNWSSTMRIGPYDRDHHGYYAVYFNSGLVYHSDPSNPHAVRLVRNKPSAASGE